jgi:hypothetical protein
VDALLIPFGQAADGRMVTVETVPQGLHCDCVCPECERALIAAKGDIYRHHFRHAADPCERGGETALHRFAKQVICETKQLRLPRNVMGAIVSATPETKTAGLIPDVLVEYDSGERLAVEIWVAHQVPDEKIGFYNQYRLAAMEIDLRPYRFAHYTQAQWTTLILETAERQWLSPPRVIREEREAAKQRYLQELADQIREAELADERAKSIEEVRALEFDRRQREREEKQRQADEAEWRRLEVEIDRLRVERELAEAAYEAEQELRAAHSRELADQRERMERQRLEEQIARQVIARRTREALIAEMSPPDLQRLVRDHGGWGNITPAAWGNFDQRTAVWEKRRLAGDFHRSPYVELRREADLRAESTGIG